MNNGSSFSSSSLPKPYFSPSLALSLPSLSFSFLTPSSPLPLPQKLGALKVDNRLPNLVNLNEDPQLSEMLLYVLNEGEEDETHSHISS